MFCSISSKILYFSWHWCCGTLVRLSEGTRHVDMRRLTYFQPSSQTRPCNTEYSQRSTQPSIQPTAQPSVRPSAQSSFQLIFDCSQVLNHLRNPNSKPSTVFATQYSAFRSADCVRFIQTLSDLFRQVSAQLSFQLVFSQVRNQLWSLPFNDSLKHRSNQVRSDCCSHRRSYPCIWPGT